MTTARIDSVLGCMVYPVVITFGDQPPQEIGVVRAAMGPEQAIAELAGVLHDAADIMVVGGDEAIRLARIRYAELQRGLGAELPEVVDYSACGPECGCKAGQQQQGRTYHQGPSTVALGERVTHDGAIGDCPVCAPLAAYDAGVLGRLAVEVTGHAVAEARMLTTAEAAALQHRADGGARLVAVAEAEADEVVVSRGQLRGHCAHDITLDRPCTMCDRV